MGTEKDNEIAKPLSAEEGKTLWDTTLSETKKSYPKQKYLMPAPNSFGTVTIIQLYDNNNEYNKAIEKKQIENFLLKGLDKDYTINQLTKVINNKEINNLTPNIAIKKFTASELKIIISPDIEKRAHKFMLLKAGTLVNDIIAEPLDEKLNYALGVSPALGLKKETAKHLPKAAGTIAVLKILRDIEYKSMVKSTKNDIQKQGLSINHLNNELLKSIEDERHETQESLINSLYSASLFPKIDTNSKLGDVLPIIVADTFYEKNSQGIYALDKNLKVSTQNDNQVTDLFQAITQQVTKEVKQLDKKELTGNVHNFITDQKEKLIKLGGTYKYEPKALTKEQQQEREKLIKTKEVFTNSIRYGAPFLSELAVAFGDQEAAQAISVFGNSILQASNGMFAIMEAGGMASALTTLGPAPFLMIGAGLLMLGNFIFSKPKEDPLVKLMLQGFDYLASMIEKLEQRLVRIEHSMNFQFSKLTREIMHEFSKVRKDIQQLGGNQLKIYHYLKAFEKRMHEKLDILIDKPLDTSHLNLIFYDSSLPSEHYKTNYDNVRNIALANARYENHVKSNHGGDKGKLLENLKQPELMIWDVANHAHQLSTELGFDQWLKFETGKYNKPVSILVNPTLYMDATRAYTGWRQKAPEQLRKNEEIIEAKDVYKNGLLLKQFYSKLGTSTELIGRAFEQVDKSFDDFTSNVTKFVDGYKQDELSEKIVTDVKNEYGEKVNPELNFYNSYKFDEKDRYCGGSLKSNSANWAIDLGCDNTHWDRSCRAERSDKKRQLKFHKDMMIDNIKQQWNTISNTCSLFRCQKIPDNRTSPI